jgi:hypothetical protein
MKVCLRKDEEEYPVMPNDILLFGGNSYQNTINFGFWDEITISHFYEILQESFINPSVNSVRTPMNHTGSFFDRESFFNHSISPFPLLLSLLTRPALLSSGSKA